MCLQFGLEVLPPASREAKQAQREFARCTAGICEFHHEHMFMTLPRKGLPSADRTSQIAKSGKALANMSAH